MANAAAKGKGQNKKCRGKDAKRQEAQLFVYFCYSLVIIIFGFLGWKSSNSMNSLIIIAIIGICTYIAILKWDINSTKSSNFYFRQNNIFALMLFIYLLTF